MKRADYVCTKRFAGGPQKERFLDLEWTLKLEPDEFKEVLVENQELKTQVCMYARLCTILVRKCIYTSCFSSLDWSMCKGK